MSKFEFIIVLVSIIFGLGLTNLLSGVLQAFLGRKLTDTRIAWTIYVGNILLINWWLLFRWSDHIEWRFHEFLYLTMYATVHYLMAVSLYPSKLLLDNSEELQRKFVLVSVLVVYAMDIGENFVRGNLFEPWYYLLLMLYLAILTVAPLVTSRPWVMRASGWIMAISLLIWSVVVRSILAS
jgi:hypothetical protein